MFHGQATPRLYSPDPKAARIAQLSEEYLTAHAARKEEIGVEICGLMNESVLPFDPKMA
ncbi:MAG: hypothetical protein AAGD04_15955 [Pseudomonadota bacterium]